MLHDKMNNNGQIFQLTNFYQPQSKYSLTRMKDTAYYWYYIVVRTAFLFFVYLMRLAGFWLPGKTILSDIDIFENTIYPSFLKFVDCDNVDNYREKNQNIDPIFYYRKGLVEVMKNENNNIEKQWNARVLIQYTPRGNIIMFYDAYKGGFAYYSDHTAIPIRILNAVAMKYVMRFFCLDFFVDEIALKNNTSPIIPLLDEEDREENEKIKKVLTRLSENTKVDAEKMPFLKPKNYQATVEADTTAVEPVNKEKRINKFIHLGKINNYSILQKKKKIHISPIDKQLEEMDEFKNVSWEEYKIKRRK